LSGVLQSKSILVPSLVLPCAHATMTTFCSHLQLVVFTERKRMWLNMVFPLGSCFHTSLTVGCLLQTGIENVLAEA
jgi:hypothetical protein